MPRRYLQSDLVESPPDRGDVLHPDPVILHVLAVGDVGGVSGELGRDLTERPQRGRGECATVAAHPHHEVFGFQQVDVLVAGEAAVVPLFALGVEAPPAHTAAQVVFIDAVEALLGVHIFDAFPYLERGTCLLELFVGIERLAIPQRPLALISGFCRAGCGHSAVSFANIASLDAQHTGCYSGRRRTGGQYRWAGSTTSRRTATAADTLEIDMPTRHQRNARIRLGDGHAAILPWMPTSHASRSDLFSR